MPIRYKYRADSLFTENIFKKQKVWLSKPAELNDPLDCKIAEFTDEYRKKFSEQQKRSQLEGFISSLVFLGGFLYGLEKSKNLLQKIKAAQTFEEKFQIANEELKAKGSNGYSDSNDLISSVTSQIESAGLFCVSETCTNGLMWSHYAGEHQGLCIGFEQIGKGLLTGEQFRQVKYTQEFPKVDLTKGHISKREFYMDANLQVSSRAVVAFHDESMLKALSTKSLDWAYEKEWRLISKLSGERDLPGKINQIIFGLRCSQIVRLKYIKLAQKYLGYEPNYFEVIQERDSYSFAIKKYDLVSVL